MKNVAIFALSNDNARNALIALEHEKIIDIKAWLGVENGMGVITHDYSKLLSIDILKKHYEICDQKIYLEIYKNLYIFLDMFARNGDIPIYESVNVFNMWVNFYYSLFKEKKIEIIIWGDIPHFGMDSIAKNVADAMGIKTIMFMQSPMTNKFWSFSLIDDIGIFETIKNNAKEKVVIEKKYEKELFYMKDINKKSDRKTIQSLILVFRKSVTKIIYFAKKINEYKEKDLYNRIIIKIYNKIFMKFRNLYCRKLYDFNINHYSKQTVNLDSNYVYFPLHLQPEMTTSALGKEYCDQLLALEKLQVMIPDEWKIYVKENPKQTYYMREENFFKRLSLIPKVILVGKKYNTYDLIKNSQFVSTISGTAGWEAITGGKNVLVFGLAWYRRLPGVFEYTRNISLDEILSYRISHKDLENKHNELMNKAYTGVLECGYEVVVKGYTHEKNNELLYKAFKEILKQIE